MCELGVDDSKRTYRITTIQYRNTAEASFLDYRVYDVLEARNKTL